MRWYAGVSAFSFAVLLFVVANTGALGAAPRTISVDGSFGVDSSLCFAGGVPCRTFQFAVNIANPGDTVCLKPGPMYQETRIAKEISLSCSGRVSSVVLEKGARISGTFEVAADKVQVMSGARLQDGVELAGDRGTVSVDKGEFGIARIAKSITILGTPGEAVAVSGCPVMRGGTVINAAGSPFGIVQAGSFSLTMRDVSIEGAREAGVFTEGSRYLTLERVFVRTSPGGVGIYVLNASGGSLASGSICGPGKDGQGVVLSGSRLVSVRDYGIWRHKIAIGVVGYREYGDTPLRAVENKVTENFLVFNEVGVRVEGYSEYTLMTGNRFFANEVAVQSVALNRDGFEHSAPWGTKLRSNSIFGGRKGVESFVLGNGSGEIESEAVDARENWWGTFTGPREAVSNQRGAGAFVSGPVLFGPWCGSVGCEAKFSVAKRLVFIPESSRPSAASFNLVVEVQDEQGNLAVNFEGRVRLSWSSACGNLRGTREATARDGRANFYNLSIAGLRNGCEFTAASTPTLTEASSRNVFTPVVPGDPSSVALPPRIPEPETEVSNPVLSFEIPKSHGVVSFTVTGIWSSAALAAKLQEQGCKVASLLRLEDGELTDYIDQLSGRRNPIFPEVLFRGTTMIVWCQ